MATVLLPQGPRTARLQQQQYIGSISPPTSESEILVRSLTSNRTVLYNSGVKSPSTPPAIGNKSPSCCPFSTVDSSLRLREMLELGCAIIIK
ncbi:unnamed protein product [Tetraodon nigroviridis]|uniref:(spotted green pufferfish) hypothetical protein n=1 Tax=Tetraodon nigroviridis TaxID=99883 RepID=Q4S533_TETNG|nr:unnamed protein product [Tetraodon nigroviridis]